MTSKSQAFGSTVWSAGAVFCYLQMHVSILLITAVVPISIITMGETDFEVIAEISPSFKPFANWLIATGGVTFFISALSILAGLVKNRSFRIIMTVFLVLNFLFVIGLVVWSFVWPEERKIFFHDAWDEMEQDAKNLIQKHYSCCGFENHTEYDKKIPTSCYSPEQQTMWRDGCYARVTTVSVFLPGPSLNGSDGVLPASSSKTFHTFFAAYVLSFGILILFLLISSAFFIASQSRRRKYKIPNAAVDAGDFPEIHENNLTFVNNNTDQSNGGDKELPTQNDDREGARPSSADITSTNEPKRKCYQKIPDAISSSLEKTFYWIGGRVGTFPKTTIALTFLLAGSLFIGLLQRVEQDSGGNGYLKRDAQVIKNSILRGTVFPAGERNQFLLIVDEENILTREKFNIMFDIFLRVQNINDSQGRTFSQLCARNAGKCKQRSIFELWNFDENIIRNLSTSDILSTLNGEVISPVFGDRINVSSILGELSRSPEGRIIGAKAHLMYYALARKAEEWERTFIDVGNARYEGVSVYVESRISRKIEIDSSYQNEYPLVFGGFGLIFIYITMMTGKFSLLEHRTYVAMMGIVTAGLAMGSGIALAASLGFKWSVIHLVAPFLIIGIGVDDMFIIIQTWNMIEDDPKLKRLDLPEKSAHALKTAGVSITITSVTDLLAFAVGASSELASFASFSVYVASSIILLFVLQCTLFFACAVLDQGRREKKLDACVPCCVRHGKNYKPTDCSRRELFASFFEDVLGQVVQMLPVQIIVILITLGLTGFMAWGFSLLKISFNLNWYLPQDSYMISFYNQHEKYFSAGKMASLYIIDIDFYEEREKLHLLYEKITRRGDIDVSTLNSWFENYVMWMESEKNITNIYAPQAFNSSQEFYGSVKEFLMTAGMAHVNDVAIRGGKLIGSRFPFRHKEINNDLLDADVMDNVQRDCDSMEFSGQAFPFGRHYFTLAITKIIRQEVYRNIGIMLLCVYLIVLPTIASFQMSVWVIFCVVFTIVDVAGSMHFAGLSIETSTIITLLLTVGLAVDYAAHIAHKFLTLRGTRKLRIRVTLAQIGPAVFNGGFSTFLALVMLSVSDLYSYKVFFTIFASVVGYGLWNGLVFLPCVLALVGPAPHKSATDAKLSQRHLRRKADRKKKDTSNGDASDIVTRTEHPARLQEMPKYTDAITAL